MSTFVFQNCLEVHEYALRQRKVVTKQASTAHSTSIFRFETLAFSSALFLLFLSSINLTEIALILVVSEVSAHCVGFYRRPIQLAWRIPGHMSSRIMHDLFLFLPLHTTVNNVPLAALRHPTQRWRI